MGLVGDHAPRNIYYYQRSVFESEVLVAPHTQFEL